MWMTLWILAMPNLPRLSKGCISSSSRYPARSFSNCFEDDCILHQTGPFMEFASLTHKFHFASRGWPPSDDLEYHHPSHFLIPPALLFGFSRTERNHAFAFLLVFYRHLRFDFSTNTKNKPLMLCGYGIMKFWVYLGIKS